jgi:hypothetical protein
MNVVTWRHANLGYALIAEPGGVDLTALGAQISSSTAVPLYGSVYKPVNGRICWVDSFFIHNVSRQRGIIRLLRCCIE